jgi:4-carboxymuconolactone decarboxylase
MSTTHFERIDRPGRRQPRAPDKARIAPLRQRQWTDAERRLATRWTRDGHVDNGIATLRHFPALADAVLPYTRYLAEESTLRPRHRQLVILRVSWLCGNSALWATHAARAREADLNPAEIRRVAEGWDSPLWDPFEATLLQMADQIYRNASLDDAAWQALRERYEIRHLLDVIETATHFIALSMLYNSLGVEPDTDDRLPTDVVYRVRVPEPEPPLMHARVEPLSGTGFAVTRTFLHHLALNQPRVYRLHFINSLSPLSPRHREMLILRMGWNCRSEYEWAQHVGSVGRAREHGLEPMLIAEGAGAAGWTPLEKALLTAADELCRDTVVSDPTWAELSAVFDTPLLLTAMFTASTYWAMSASLNTIGVQLEPGNERFPALPTR